MTTWQYAYLHQHETRHIAYPNQQIADAELGPAAFIVADSGGARILVDASDLLTACNAVGALGWNVQVPATWNGTGVDEKYRKMIKNHLGADYEPSHFWTYMLRRAID